MWEQQFLEKMDILNSILKGGPYTVTIYNKGLNGHFQVKEVGTVIYTAQGKSLHAHWKQASRKALMTICEHKINALFSPVGTLK
jgi:hypothetical protein